MFPIIVLMVAQPQLVMEQLSRPEERRCPLGKASNEVVELLSVHWNIFAPGCQYSHGVLRHRANNGRRFYIHNIPTLFSGFLQGPLPGHPVLP